MLFLQCQNIYHFKIIVKFVKFGNIRIIQSLLKFVRGSFKIYEINSRAVYYTKVVLVNEQVSPVKIQLIMGK